MTTALQLESNPCDNSFMGTTKPTGDWKFWLQLSVIMVAIGGGLQANAVMQAEVQDLKRMDKVKTETILRMEGKFDLLNLQIQQLKERLEAKKIVNSAAFDAANIVGERIIER
jgi:hypothetical protein